MNSGRVFAGIVGGSNRLEYTVMRDAVNFAARLMQSAEDYQIITSNNIKNKSERIFNFNYLGKKYFKGKEDLQDVHLLEKEKEEEIELKEIKIFGRKKEIKEFMGYLDKASKGNPVAFFIEGEAGIGKSYLSNYIIKFAEKKVGKF